MSKWHVEFDVERDDHDWVNVSPAGWSRGYTVNGWNIYLPPGATVAEYHRPMFTIKPDDESEEDVDSDWWAVQDTAFRSNVYMGAWMLEEYGVEWNPDLTF